jgi:ribokinase
LKVVSTGAINWDINLFIDNLDMGGMEAPVRKITRVPGGKAANVAVAAARLLGGDEKAGILGAVGSDDIGRVHMKIFAEEGVSTEGLFVTDQRESGQAYILVDSFGRNQIFTYFGANAFLTPELASSEKAKKFVLNSNVVVAMDPPLEYTKVIFEEASGGPTVIWGPGVRTLGHREQILALLRYVDYILLNQQELRVLTGEESPEKGYQYLKKYSDSIKLLITLGENGASLYDREYVLNERGVDLAGHNLSVVNTVGCGDAFVGCFAASIANGMSESEALFRANHAGAFKSTRIETRGSPTSKELEEFIKKVTG